ncbi:CoA-acylating methylmalonate-semialdehyde dehydrogenase [Silvanigrella aquatica]|uniref:Methylmalonate-semialdehyde dehydrogenase (Acylating) n=1 Tax=Silvanigrella aquatica TaxID=1915309 RepID=A0A1L4D186_9BACT|nr:CoA-acylating methylmalonate-semialdehyde dehydrogenase [Silvanigrella aquatica]APJ03969.1 methylmalonate-semialdehyde dehydrogenase (acylating) [Silvanigrella aquatica]
MSYLSSSEKIIECFNFIGGKWTSPDEKMGSVLCPFTGKAIANTYRSYPKTIENAVKIAKQAQLDWGQQSLRERAQIMAKFQKWLQDNSNSLSQTISNECGKLPQEARDGLMKGIEILEFAASMQNHDTMTKMLVSKGIHCEFRREPLGVVAGITPSNFPAMVPLWMLPIALMVGNSFIWKPSEKTPMTSLLICNGFKECGLPDGILNVIQGDKITVESICDHPDIQAVAFVGSTPAAKSVYTRATAQGKRALTLGGAKNHIILMPDAQLELASDGILASFSGCAGQRCMAASVLLAVGDCDHIIEDIVTKAQKFQAGKDIGAVITKQSLERLQSAIEKSVHEGAKLSVDGRYVKVPDELSQGNWLNPTILDNVNENSFAATEELFGPILSIVRCKNLDHAMKIENENPYGNAASVFTTRGDVAEYVTLKAKSGMIGINVGIPVPREPFSFGGINQSKFGHGDITGNGGIEFWSNRKKVTTKWTQITNQNWMS